MVYTVIPPPGKSKSMLASVSIDSAANKKKSATLINKAFLQQSDHNNDSTNNVGNISSTIDSNSQTVLLVYKYQHSTLI